MGLCWRQVPAPRAPRRNFGGTFEISARNQSKCLPNDEVAPQPRTGGRGRWALVGLAVSVGVVAVAIVYFWQSYDKIEEI